MNNRVLCFLFAIDEIRQRWFNQLSRFNFSIAILIIILQRYSIQAEVNKENVVNLLLVKYKSSRGILLSGMCFLIK